MVTVGNSVRLQDDHSLPTLFPSTGINNGNDQERSNLVFIHDSVQDQPVLSGFHFACVSSATIATVLIFFHQDFVYWNIFPCWMILLKSSATFFFEEIFWRIDVPYLHWDFAFLSFLRHFQTYSSLVRFYFHYFKGEFSDYAKRILKPFSFFL